MSRQGPGLKLGGVVGEFVCFPLCVCVGSATCPTRLHLETAEGEALAADGKWLEVVFRSINRSLAQTQKFTLTRVGTRDGSDKSSVELLSSTTVIVMQMFALDSFIATSY